MKDSDELYPNQSGNNDEGDRKDNPIEAFIERNVL